MKIGTVDMFQGRESPIVIISMTDILLQGAPKGADFLSSRHHFNVSLSRAKALAIVGGSRSNETAKCKDANDMELANLLC